MNFKVGDLVAITKNGANATNVKEGDLGKIEDFAMGVYSRFYYVKMLDTNSRWLIDANYLKLVENVSDKAVDHPSHYGGADNPFEAIKVIEAWNLNFNIGNTVKYLSRAGKKDPTKLLEDMKKAKWYLEREIAKLERT